MDVGLAAERDRRELAELLHDLSPGEWEARSLCERWTVREVVAHVLSYEGLGPAQVLRRMAQGRMTFDRMNAVALRDHRTATPDELLARLARHPRPEGLTAMMGGAVGLVDGMIHQQDIRRPLGRLRQIEPQALRFAVVAPPLRGFWRVRGTRVVATDVDWSYGRGAEVRGPGEAVLLTLAGRVAAHADLAGPGVDLLRRRAR